MKKLISNNWRKVLILIGAVLIIMNLSNKMSSKINVIDSYNQQKNNQVEDNNKNNSKKENDDKEKDKEKEKDNNKPSTKPEESNKPIENNNKTEDDLPPRD